MAKVDKRKQSVYIPEEMLASLKVECARLDRSLSWVIQRCVKVALPEVQELPGMDD